MTRFAYVFLLSFLLIFAELLAESAGLRLLLFAPFIFYISYATDIRTGCAVALLGGMVLDFCFGYANPWSAVFFLFAVLLARLWLRRLGSDSRGLLLIPGAVLPFLTQFPAALIQSGFSHSGLLDAASDAVTASVCTALILPLAVLFWDWLASLFSLALFSDARERLKETLRD